MAQRLTLREIRLATATPIERFKNLVYRNLHAFAWGRSVASDSLTYFEVDALALMLTETLAKSYSRTVAAQLVRLHCDTWIAALAMAEANPDRPAYFSIVDFFCKGKRGHIACG